MELTVKLAASWTFPDLFWTDYELTHIGRYSLSRDIPYTTCGNRDGLQKYACAQRIAHMNPPVLNIMF